MQTTSLSRSELFHSGEVCQGTGGGGDTGKTYTL